MELETEKTQTIDEGADSGITIFMTKLVRKAL